MLRLIDYMRLRDHYAGRTFDAQPHNHILCRAIEQCVAGTLPDGKRNLMLNLPPRFGKTETCMAAVEWSLGHVPDSQFIMASYALGRARESSVSIRDIVRQKWYSDCFPRVKVPMGHDRMDEWQTTEKGQVRAAGVGGPITGFGAGTHRDGFGGFFLIDDPIKPDDARASEVIRKSNIDWYTGTALTRLNKRTTPMILIMHRSSPDDLSGWILKNEPDLWHRVIVQGYNAEQDKATWPAKADLNYLNKLKEIDPFTFYGQYQQLPVPPGGAMIRESWWQFYADLNEVRGRCNFILMTADTALKEGAANDYSVFQVWGIEGAERIYLLDQIRGKWLFPDLLEAAKMFWKKWEPNILFVEDAVSGTSLIQMLDQIGEINVAEWRAKDFGLDRDDKVSRMKSASWSIHAGSVWLPDPEIAPWIREFLDEVSTFSEDMSHRHDDQADALSMAILTWSRS